MNRELTGNIVKGIEPSQLIIPSTTSEKVAVVFTELLYFEHNVTTDFISKIFSAGVKVFLVILMIIHLDITALRLH